MARVQLDIVVRAREGGSTRENVHTYVYDRGTTDEVTGYTTAAGATEVTYPLFSNAEGRFPNAFYPIGSYDIHVEGDNLDDTQPWEAVSGDGMVTDIDLAAVVEPLAARTSFIEATRPRFDLKRDFGAVGDGVTVLDGAMNGTTATLTCATSAPFASDDVGKWILVIGAGDAGNPLNPHLLTTISAFTDSSHVTLAAPSETAVTDAIAVFGTDDAAAIQDAVDVMAAEHTALCSVPDGIYVMMAEQQEGNENVKGQVLFPSVTGGDPVRSIGFVGGQSVPFGMPESVQVNGVDSPIDTAGAIFCSLRTSPNLGTGSVFAANANPSGAVLTKSVVTFDGVTIRCPPANAITALNLYWGAGMDLGTRFGLRIDVIANPPSIPEPQAAPAGSYGLVTPKFGNWAHLRIGNLDISGYTHGLAPTEHISAQNINISFCLQAIQQISGYLGVWIGRLCTYACPKSIVAAAVTPNPITIGQWAIQNEPGLNQPEWIMLVSHLDASFSDLVHLQGSAQAVVRAMGGEGNIADLLVQDQGPEPNGRIAFAVGKQYVNYPTPMVLDPSAPRQVSINALATPRATVGTWAVAQSSTNFLGGTQFNSTNAQDDAIHYHYVYLGGGTWSLDFIGVTRPNGAIATVDIRDVNEALIATGTIDLYAAAITQSRLTLAGLAIPNAGLYRVVLRAATRNVSNTTGWTIQVSSLCLTRTA